MVRVLIVEDSPTACALLRALLEADPLIRVIGTAANGAEGLEETLRLKPDLITMDVQMPVIDGMEATRRIMQECPTPIIVVSAGIHPGEVQTTFNAIRAGALDVIEKPGGPGSARFQELHERLVTSVKLMAEVKVVRRRGLPRLASPLFDAPGKPHGRLAVVAIGSSTGGPGVLHVIFKALPREFPLPIVVVQHMLKGFVESLVRWLQAESPLRLRLARAHEHIRPGTVYFAPDDQHLFFESRDVLGLDRSAAVSHVRPSATVLLNSVAKFYGAEAAGIILTGMGDDGAAGLKTIREHGGMTLAQDEATSVVYGMPEVAVALGAVDRILPLDRIPLVLMELSRAHP